MAVTSKVRRGATTRGGALTLAKRSGLSTVHEADDGLERDLHLESGGASLFPARFDLRILGDRGGNRVGQLSGEPVDDVVHSSVLPRPTEIPDWYESTVKTPLCQALTRIR